MSVRRGTPIRRICSTSIAAVSVSTLSFATKNRTCADVDEAETGTRGGSCEEEGAVDLLHLLRFREETPSAVVPACLGVCVVGVDVARD